MIEFSCHSWAFNDLTLPEALGTIARLGFRGVDVGTGPHLNAVKAAADPRRVVRELTADLRLFSLRLTDLYLMLPRISLPDEEPRRRDIDLFKALIPFAKALDTAGITVSPGVKQSDETALKRTTDALQEMIDAAEDINISIEPHMDSMAETPQAALQLLDAVPGLSLTLDWSHFVYQGIDYEAVEPLLPHVRHVHVRQAAKGKLQTGLADGVTDFARILAQLKTVGYSGTVCIEYMKTPGWHAMQEVNALRESARLRDLLRDLLRSAVPPPQKKPSR